MTEHKHAAILRQIAEDKDTEIECLHDIWEEATQQNVIAFPQYEYRIKPKPFIINNIECPRPVKAVSGIQPCLRIDAQNSVERRDGWQIIYFASDAALMQVFNAVIKPFEERGK